MKKLVLDEAIEAAQTFFQNYNINKRWIWKQSKERKFVEARFFVCAFMRARDPKKFSFPVIARAIKRSDHTTALNAVRMAHEFWGERLFLKLAAVRPVETTPEQTSPHVVHEVTAEELLAVGEANLARFVNGKGWEQAA